MTYEVKYLMNFLIKNRSDLQVLKSGERGSLAPYVVSNGIIFRKKEHLSKLDLGYHLS